MGDDANELLAHLTGASVQTQPVPATLLAALADGPASPSALANEYDLDRQRVYQRFEPLTDHRAVLHDDGTFRWTGLGVVLHRILEETVTDSGVTRAAIAFLTASEYRGWILSQLRTNPATKAELAGDGDRPSRATVHRAITAFEERGWVMTTADSSGYEVTPTGERLSLAYDTATTAIEHALSRAPFLTCCDTTVDHIPLAGLAAADQYVIRPELPDPSRDIRRQMQVTELDSYRGFMSVVSRDLAETGDEIIRSNAETELIITERVLYNLPTKGPYAAHVKRGLEATNFTLLVVPDVDVLPIGLSILDGERVIMSPADLEQIPGSGPASVVMGSDPALVRWCESLYETYRERARSPSRQVLSDLKDRVTAAVSRTSDSED